LFTEISRTRVRWFTHCDDFIAAIIMLR